jgi:hypothetical protein
MSENGVKKIKWDKIDHMYVDEIIFLSLIFLCFFGEILVEVSERIAIVYWLFMAPVFCYASVLSGIVKARIAGDNTKHLIKGQLLFWSSAFGAILLIFLAWHAAILSGKAVGLMVHIILAHTVFVSGVVLGFRFYLVGALLFCTASLTIVMEAHFTIDLLVAIPFIILGLYWEKKHLFPILRRKSGMAKIIDDDAPDRSTN